MSALPLAPILRRVARSFALSLRLLPGQTRDATALAYLLARAADTVADTRLVPRPRRARLLEELREVFQGRAPLEPLLPALAALQDEGLVIAEEQELLQQLPRCLELLELRPADEVALVREVLDTLTGGMVLDLQRFPGDSPADLRSLQVGDELLDYTWRVAGCVGEFWSRLHVLRLPSCRRVDLQAWCREGVALGRALQLTNVLRDLRRDLEHGRCYLPARELAAVGLAPPDLLEPRRWPELRPVWLAWVRRALAEARVGLGHVLRTPAREPLLRLAAYLPLLLAVETLGVAAQGNPLDPASRKKVPRRVVWRTLVRGAVRSRDARALAVLYRSTVRRAGLEALA